MAEAGTDARFTEVIAAVRTAYAAIGVRAPSSGMVHREMMRARQQPVAYAAELSTTSRWRLNRACCR